MAAPPVVEGSPDPPPHPASEEKKPPAAPAAGAHGNNGAESAEKENGWEHSMRDGETVAVDEPPAASPPAPAARRRARVSPEDPGEPLPLKEAVEAVPAETRRLLEELFRGEFKGVRRIDREKLF